MNKTEEWLRRGWKINEEIQFLIQERRNFTEFLGQCGAVENREFLNYEKTLNNKITELCKIKNEIAGAIGRVEDVQCRTLLTLRYLSFKTWEKIAEDMYYSDYWIRKALHKKALKALEKTIYLQEDKITLTKGIPSVKMNLSGV